jgi:ribosomal protein L7Ae-like RNA K-turn-binding protein
MWLSASADLLHSDPGEAMPPRALARAFARAARGPVTIPADLHALLQAGLLRRITELLGLARRAGQAVGGFDKAREMLQAGRANLVVQAADGSPAERARFLSGLGHRLEVIDPLAGAALGQVFGRDYVVHVAVTPGKLATALVQEAGRLAGLRGMEGSARTRERNTAPVNKDMGANG